jgi:hypothetical protein
MSKTMSSTNNFGLVAKTHSSPEGDEKTLNFKVKIASSKYDKWTNAVDIISTEYNGGGSAIILNAIETLLPQLEAMAEEITSRALATKGGAK